MDELPVTLSAAVAAVVLVLALVIGVSDCRRTSRLEAECRARGGVPETVRGRVSFKVVCLAPQELR